jgi:excisionase family DNA binding protein
MQRLIDLSDIADDQQILSSRENLSMQSDMVKKGRTNITFETISIESNSLLINEKYPDKILFTISELAGELNLSYEFIRRKIKEGLIPATSFGDRMMINKKTVVELLTYGV